LKRKIDEWAEKPLCLANRIVDYSGFCPLTEDSSAYRQKLIELFGNATRGVVHLEPVGNVIRTVLFDRSLVHL
jgi:hypothetical protein